MIAREAAIKGSKIFDLTNPIIKVYEGEQTLDELIVKVIGVPTMILHRLGYTSEQAQMMIAENWDMFTKYDDKSNPDMLKKSVKI